MDHEEFENSTTEELDNMWNNKIYEIIKKLDVLKGNIILRLVWSHIRNPTYDGNIILPQVTSM